MSRRNEIKGMNCEELVKLLKEENVSIPILDAISDSKYCGNDFLDESFPADAIDEELMSKFNVKKIQLKTLARVHAELVGAPSASPTSAASGSSATTLSPKKQGVSAYMIHKLLGEDDEPFTHEVKEKITNSLETYQDFFTLSAEELAKRSGISASDSELLEMTRQILIKEGWGNMTAVPDGDILAFAFFVGEKDFDASPIKWSPQDIPLLLVSLGHYINDNPCFPALLAKVKPSTDITCRRYYRLAGSIVFADQQNKLTSTQYVDFLQRLKDTAPHVTTSRTAHLWTLVISFMLLNQQKAIAMSAVLNDAELCKKLVTLESVIVQDQQAIAGALICILQNNQMRHAAWHSTGVIALLASLGSALELAENADAFMGAMATIADLDAEKETSFLQNPSLKSAYTRCKLLASMESVDAIQRVDEAYEEK